MKKKIYPSHFLEKINMERPFNDEQHEVLSRSFTAVNDAINHLNGNLRRAIISLNMHSLILAIVIAILIYTEPYDMITKIILWGLLCIDLSYILIIPWRRNE